MLSSRCGTVKSTRALPYSLLAGSKVTLLFESVKDGIKRTRAQLVAMPPQLFDHCETENRLLHRMVQDMQPDQAGVKVAIICAFVFCWRSHIQ